MTHLNSSNSHFASLSLKMLLFAFVAVSLFSCKNKEEKVDNPQIEAEIVTSSLEKGCYLYTENGNMINLEITKINNPIEANLTYALSEKDKNTGKLIGEFNDGKLIGTYTFKSEGKESKRQVAFMLKDNQLVEGYGNLTDDGTMFLDQNSVNYSSTMPLTKTDCDQMTSQCLFENGKSYSELEQTCLELASLEIKLNPLNDGAMTEGEAAYILFNDDNSKAEIFLPKTDKGMVLTKTNEGNWTYKNYMLISWKGYVLQENGTAIFGGE